MKLKRPLRGSERGADVRMVQRALNRWSAGRYGIPISGVYDRRTSDRLMAFQAAEGVSPADGSMEQPTLTALEPFFDLWGKSRYTIYRVPPKEPKLGPVVKGGKSILEHDLTHPTGGLDGYPAFDDAFNKAGAKVLAPEPLLITRIGGTVRRDGSPNGRSVYATGASGLLYWFAHLDSPLPVGSKVKRGKPLGRVSANHEVPHVHVGINARPAFGRELVHHTDYTHGATPVGQQLRAL